MQIRAVRLYRYCLPLGSSLSWGGQAQHARHGGIVQLLFEDGSEGLGEIAPLPGFSRESLPDALLQAQVALTTMVRAPDNQAGQPLYPSVQFALDCARARIPADQTINTGVPLLDGDAETLARRIEQLQTQGRSPTLAKLKLGSLPVQQDIDRFNQLCRDLPDCRWRLDPNRRWTPAQAEHFLKQVEISRIDFIEEPCTTPAQTLQLADHTECPLAWDESLQQAKAPPLAHPQLQALVVKPTLVGGFQRCLQLRDWARAHHCELVVSASVESQLGIAQLSCLATKWAPTTLPGLDTLRLLSPHRFVDSAHLLTDQLEWVWQS